MTKKLIPFLLTMAVSVTACATHRDTAPVLLPDGATTLPSPTDTPVPLPQAGPAAETPSAAWREVRDARYGFGLAIPCWWIVSPIPPQGVGGVMTISNYDEAYFMANSQKGFWDWPNGALKIDIVVIEDANPQLSDTDAYMELVDTNMQALISSETRQTGAHPAAVLTLQNLVNQNDPPIRVFIHRLAPDKLILINPIPQGILDTPDFQTLLSTMVLTPQEAITIPSTPPAETPLINAVCMQ